MSGKKWIWIILGLLAAALLVCGGFVGTITYLALRHLNVQMVTSESADREIEQVRARFAGRPPLIEIDDEDWSHPRVRRPAQGAERRRLETLHVMAWDEREGKLVRLDFPVWIMKLNMRDMSVALPSDQFAELERLKLTLEDLERHGPGLILDQRGRKGERVLIWTE
jgi:hypothetical protein